jgi:hypothetical protein
MSNPGTISPASTGVGDPQKFVSRSHRSDVLTFVSPNEFSKESRS